MQDLKRRCWVEINLDVIRENYKIYKNSILPQQDVMAVVKADAYGHGDIKVATALQEMGCRYFAVSNINEAIGLRDAGIRGEILILGYTPPESFDLLYGNDITQAVLSDEYAQMMIRFGKKIKCQIAIDTGMNRIGLDADDPETCIGLIHRYASDLNINGMFTHLCVADSENADDVEFTNEQIDKFQAIAQGVEDLKLEYIHCLNSAGGLWHNRFGRFARLGIILYGLKPDYSNQLISGIQPALQWKTVVSMVKDIRAGEFIGYGRSYKAPKDMLVATLSTGYADGYSRKLSNTGVVLVKGCKVPVVGRICMDQMMIDVTDIPNVRVGEIVTLLGSDEKLSYTADDMADTIGTIGYEIVCAISKRVERVYI